MPDIANNLTCLLDRDTRREKTVGGAILLSHKSQQEMLRVNQFASEPFGFPLRQDYGFYCSFREAFEHSGNTQRSSSLLGPSDRCQLREAFSLRNQKRESSEGSWMRAREKDVSTRRIGVGGSGKACG